MTEDPTNSSSSSSSSSRSVNKRQRRRADVTRVRCGIQFASDGRLAGTSASCTSTRTDNRPSNIFPIMLLPILLSSMYDSHSACVVSAFSPWTTSRSCACVFTRGKYRYPDRFAFVLNEETFDFLHRTRRRRIATALFETKNAESADRATPNLKVETRKNSGVKTKKAARGKTGKRINEKEVPLYWRSETDEFVFVDGTTDISISSTNNTNIIESIPRQRKALRFTVRGKPIPLRRHRTSRGFMYNPSAKSQLEFRRVVSDMVYSSSDDKDMSTSTNDDENKKTVLFDEHEYLAVTIIFRLRRPKSHFVGGKPGPGRLRPTSPGRLHTTRTDVDNLAKFVLDSLNELVYHDDRQVISLHVAKILDSEGHCEGATEVAISRLEESEMENFVANMIV